MKRLYWGAAITICSISLSAVAAPPPPGTVSSPPGNTGVAGSQPAQVGGGLLSNTNSSTVSVSELSQELKVLQGDIDRVLPMLTTFNQEHGADSAGKGGLTGILSRILGSRTNSNSGATSNVVSSVDRLLTTNSTSQATLSAEALRDLHDLQTQLQPVPQLLQALNGQENSVPPAGTISRSPYGTNQWNQPARGNNGLAPTGR